MALNGDNALAVGALISSEDLGERVAAILADAGMQEEDAARMSALLVFAQESGIDSHGIAHLPSYVSGIASGSLKARPAMRMEGIFRAAAVLDADCAPGVLAGLQACDEAVVRARQCGAAIIAVRNSAHFGAASAFAEYLASQGMVGLILSNASATVAPRGAKTPLFGTNPIAAGFPDPNGSPLLIDFATTAGSRGRIRKAAVDGTAIPLDWALDKNGLPTSDAKVALTGTMQALGGEKGTILPLLVELLCVALSGGHPGSEVLVPQEGSNRPRGVSHLFVAMDARAFGGVEAVGSRISLISALIENTIPVDANHPPRMPGARGAALRQKARREGIRLSSTVVAALLEARNSVDQMKKSVSPEEEFPK
ncbi:malate/lactate dehydrogenase [Phyllobacterium sp. YR531]|nr:malate/lactate dehydrogenase [Phyllobacterium sp. YR531]